MCKMKHAFKFENHYLLLLNIYMHLVQGHQKYNTPNLCLIGSLYFSFQVMRKIMKWTQKNYVQVANGIQM